jgi:hypothetical protein
MCSSTSNASVDAQPACLFRQDSASPARKTVALAHQHRTVWAVLVQTISTMAIVSRLALRHLDILLIESAQHAQYRTAISVRAQMCVSLVTQIMLFWRPFAMVIAHHLINPMEHIVLMFWYPHLK